MALLACFIMDLWLKCIPTYPIPGARARSEIQILLRDFAPALQSICTTTFGDGIKQGHLHRRRRFDWHYPQATPRFSTFSSPDYFRWCSRSRWHSLPWRGGHFQGMEDDSDSPSVHATLRLPTPLKVSCAEDDGLGFFLSCRLFGLL